MERHKGKVLEPRARALPGASYLASRQAPQPFRSRTKLVQGATRRLQQLVDPSHDRLERARAFQIALR